MRHMRTCERLVGHQVPWFERESSRGCVSPRDASGNQPRLLVFCPSLDSEECRAYLERIRSDHEEFDAMQAQVIVITAAGGGLPSGIPFAVVSDAGDLFAAFGLQDDRARPQMGVVLVDRYGRVDTCSGGATTRDLPAEHVLATRLRTAEAQCPECGVPERDWAAVEEA